MSILFVLEDERHAIDEEKVEEKCFVPPDVEVWLPKLNWTELSPSLIDFFVSRQRKSSKGKMTVL